MFGIKGIVPTLILNSTITLLFSWYFSKKINIKYINVNNKIVYKEGKGLLQLGIAMSVSGILVYFSAYILRSFIRMEGGVEAVGLFTAGFTLMTTYAGLVFNAMSTDYFPRLAAVNNDNAKCREIMNQQAEIGLLILAPLMAICIIFIPIVVRALYSTKFLDANNYIIWCAVGMLFKLSSWSVAFIFVAKGESKVFMINEIVSGVYTLVLNLLGYYFGGLTGLGIAFFVGYFIYTIHVYVESRLWYDFSFSTEFVKMFALQFILVSACIIVLYVASSIVIKYTVGSVLVLVSAFYSLRGLDEKLGLRNIIHKKKR